MMMFLTKTTVAMVMVFAAFFVPETQCGVPFDMDVRVEFPENKPEISQPELPTHIADCRAGMRGRCSTSGTCKSRGYACVENTHCCRLVQAPRKISN